ncbi:unnamed protein product [Acanthoscelides obtectus]|uniref:Uncharacterized protein n=1 Tax=Acanthoscelides obtectus TaxID=200917 RepID=A0A9P0JN33_ACAOB|nr:unnamed protein product [Acanthoscelides obtectus]CAK1625812.1 hypothetical protein AOBTE_LOCUS3416 [Acanthoscelides obtectus]
MSTYCLIISGKTIFWKYVDKRHKELKEQAIKEKINSFAQTVFEL